MPAARHVRFDPESLLAVLNAHDVAYVVIGGFAALLHGSALPTRDLDVTPSPDKANLARLSAALTELQARIRTDAVPEGLPFSHNAASLAGAGSWNLQTAHGDLDLSFVPSGTQGYSDLSVDAERVALSDMLTIRIAALADIIRSKDAANRDKDRRALPLLRRLLDDQIEASRQQPEG